MITLLNIFYTLLTEFISLIELAVRGLFSLFGYFHFLNIEFPRFVLLVFRSSPTFIRNGLSAIVIMFIVTGVFRMLHHIKGAFV